MPVTMPDRTVSSEKLKEMQAFLRGIGEGVSDSSLRPTLMGKFEKMTGESIILWPLKPSSLPTIIRPDPSKHLRWARIKALCKELADTHAKDWKDDENINKAVHLLALLKSVEQDASKLLKLLVQTFCADEEAEEIKANVISYRCPQNQYVVVRHINVFLDGFASYLQNLSSHDDVELGYACVPESKISSLF